MPESGQCICDTSDKVKRFYETAYSVTWNSFTESQLAATPVAHGSQKYFWGREVAIRTLQWNVPLCCRMFFSNRFHSIPKLLLSVLPACCAKRGSRVMHTHLNVVSRYNKSNRIDETQSFRTEIKKKYAKFTKNGEIYNALWDML